MKLERISLCDFDAIYAQMEENFIAEERRDREAARAILSAPDYEILHLIEDGARVGFVTLWHLGEIVFAEHFVVYAAYRNRGCGARALALLQELYAHIVLEAEPPIGEIPTRRIAFYERNGFFQNAYPYIQPPYKKGEVGVPLVLMSFPAPLADPAAVASLLHERVYGVQAVDLILDTDFGSDCDDAMALAYLSYARRCGAVRLRAIAHSNGCVEGPWAIQLMLEQMGEPVPPIGKAEVELKAYDHYCKQIVETFGRGKTPADVERAVAVLRRALCESENAVICAVGAMTNLAALLESKGDAISPLDGIALVKKHCRSIVLMAGIFDPAVTRIEWNIHLDVPAARTVAEHSPVPVIWLPSETGAGVITGGCILRPEGKQTPLSLSFMLFPGVIKRGGRSSWDPITALYAVEGVGDFLEESASGTVTVDAEGKTTFAPSAKGTHRILTLKQGAEQALAARIDTCAKWVDRSTAEM